VAEVLVIHVAEDLEPAGDVVKALVAEGHVARPIVPGPKALTEGPARFDLIVIHTGPAQSSRPFATLMRDAAARARRTFLVRADQAEVAPWLARLLLKAPRFDLADGITPIVTALRSPPTAGKRPAMSWLPDLKLGEAGSVASPKASVWKAWAGSFGLHLFFLVLLGYVAFRVQSLDPAELESAIVAGDPNGDVSGLSRQMGGSDDTEMPWADDLTMLEGPTLTLTPLAELKLDSAAPRAKGPGAQGAGGGRGGEGFGMAHFGPGNETIRGVEVRTGDPQFTLIWDSSADLDLHVIEPGGAHIYWVEKGRPSKLGGMLDVDNVKGFGPENVYWSHGKGPPGEYKWYVQYFGGFGGYDVPTKWQVRIKKNGEETIIDGRFRKIGEKSKVYTLRVGPSRGKSDEASP
jgi:hypothetical protein